MTSNLAKRSFWVGVILIILGVVVLFNAALASGAIVIVTGILLIFSGAAQIVLGLSDQSSGNKWLTIGLGAITLILGGSFISSPLAGVISLTLFLLILIAASGAVQIILAIRSRGTPFFWSFLVTGLVSVGLAVILFSSPAATLSFLGMLLGIHLLASGIGLALMGMLMKKAGISRLDIIID